MNSVPWVLIEMGYVRLLSITCRLLRFDKCLSDHEHLSAHVGLMRTSLELNVQTQSL